MSRTVRSILVLLVGAAAVVYMAVRLGSMRTASTQLILSRDFVEYWSAGRVNLRGQNPYDAATLFEEQLTTDSSRGQAVMMWNPPPSLALYMPFGALSARQAALPWVGLQLLAVILACDMLWRTYAPDRPRGLAQLVAISFVGTWWVVAYGQNTGLLLFGLAGFLHYTRRGKPIAAGACAALTALKPHLLAGFGVLLVADVLVRRGRIALATGVGAIAAALGLALLANPAVVSQFIDAVRNPGPGAVPLQNWTLPVASYWLRIGLAPTAFWVQFVPCAVACVLLLVWRFRAGAAWDWARALPVVVTASVLTTPYGGWIFDLPVLLVPVVWCAARIADRPLLLVVFLIGQAAVTAFSFAKPGGLHEYWWVAPAALALCVLPVCRMPVAEPSTHGARRCLPEPQSTGS